MERWSNTGASTLASAITATATSLSLATGGGSKFAAVPSGDYSYLTLDDGTNVEIVLLTAISGDTLTVVRAQQNTVAQAFAVGTKVEQRITASPMGALGGLDVLLPPPVIASQLVALGAVNTAAATTLALTASRTLWYPFAVNRRITVTQLSIYVTTAVASSVVDVGVYDAAGVNNLPRTRLITVTGLSGATAGQVNSGALSTVLDPGLYWACINANTGAPTLRALAAGGSASLGLTPSGTAHGAYLYATSGFTSPAPTTGFTMGTGAVPALFALYTG
jgi:hypothetical protein